MTALSVNLNKFAALRNTRGGGNPDVLHAARTVLSAGAQGITVHPRPDQRHIQPSDVYQLADLLRNDYPGIEFNIEGNPHAPANAGGYPGFDALIETTRPAQATLVPDGDNQLTSDHGFDLKGDNTALIARMRHYQTLGARVSLFMDPDLEQIELAQSIGADRIELYTGPFADAVKVHGAASPEAIASLERYRSATARAIEIGLGVNAGHDLDLENLPLFRTISGIDEVSIGHALICDALYLGLHETVVAYLEAIRAAP